MLSLRRPDVNAVEAGHGHLCRHVHTVNAKYIDGDESLLIGRADQNPRASGTLEEAADGVDC